MEDKDIFFILVQIEEAHTMAWPQAIYQVNPEQELGYVQKDFQDRVERANDFNKKDKVYENDRFKIMIDGWGNNFERLYHAWPDKYYLINSDMKVLAKSEYGDKNDALINKDCVKLIEEL